MFHTTRYTLIFGLLIALAGSPTAAQSESSKGSQDPSIKGLIDKIKKLEKNLKGVELEMATVGAYPGGLKFQTSGRLRVLGTTHFHIRVASAFLGNDDDQLRSEVEKVITPAGVETRQQGPIEIVYTKMSADLVRRLELAQKALAAADKANSGRTVAVPSILSDGGRAPLGSEMVAALDQQFDLRLQKERRKVAGVQCRVWRGVWRVPTPKGADPALAEPTGSASAELVVRPDGVPIAMRQFDQDQRQTLELRIDKLTLNPALTEKDFVLVVPAGTVFQDVMDHRPSRAQIQRLLDEYAELERPKSPPNKKSPAPR